MRRNYRLPAFAFVAVALSGAATLSLAQSGQSPANDSNSAENGAAPEPDHGNHAEPAPAPEPGNGTAPPSENGAGPEY